MTKGETRVRVDFNISGDTIIDKIKKKSAELIDLVDELVITPDGESARVKSLALTDYENAAMWAVKAATYKK